MNIPPIHIPKGHEAHVTTRPRVWADAPLYHCIGGDKRKGKVPPFKDLYITFRDMSKQLIGFGGAL